MRRREVRLRAKRPRAEPRSRPVRRRDVEGRADDRDVGLPLVELLGLGEERAPAERRQSGDAVQRQLLAHALGELAARRQRGVGHSAMVVALLGRALPSRMIYAQGRTFYDADSHIMELPDWLVEYADADVRDRIRPLYLGAAGKLADNAMRDARDPCDRPLGGRCPRVRRAAPQGMVGARGVRSGRAHPRPRSPRLRLPARVQHVRADAVPRRRPRPRVRRHAGPQPGAWSTSARTTRASCRSASCRGARPSRTARPSRRRSTSDAVRCCCRRCPKPVSRRPPTPTTIPCGGRSRRTTSRSCSTSAAAGD